ncbi:MAG: biopolymer transporter ExbD [Deltaproteobacteria bacterium]|nr:biopolymer transporter ExbD [Deltaproteobacteria bacterium]
MKKWSLVNNRNRIISDINITPLTDVMLVLLVIFMVTTPLLVMQSFKIKLPKAVSAEAEQEKGITLSITTGGAIYLNNKAVKMEGLFDSIQSEIKTASDRTVIIKADKDIMHGTVVRVLDIAKRAGAAKLSIATEPEGQSKTQ